MIGLPTLASLDHSTATRIWLATEPADMRCGFDRLAELAQVVTNQNPMDGHLFLFRSRGGDFCGKKTDFVLWYKNLETEDTHLVDRTEVERRANNQHVGLAEAGRMVGISYAMMDHRGEEIYGLVLDQKRFQRWLIGMPTPGRNRAGSLWNWPFAVQDTDYFQPASHAAIEKERQLTDGDAGRGG